MVINSSGSFFIGCNKASCLFSGSEYIREQTRRTSSKHYNWNDQRRPLVAASEI